MNRLEYTLEKFKDYIYSSESPTGVIRIKDNKVVGNYFHNPNGSPKCIKVYIKGKNYMAHRLIWLLFHGNIEDSMVIDHIDGNPFNNKVENLRLVTRKINSRNAVTLKNPTTGLLGISLHRTWTGDRKKYNDYVVVSWRYKDDGPRLKHFNLNKFPTLEHALEFAELFREMKLEGDNSYSERHGVK